jgi:hypothetical protein
MELIKKTAKELQEKFNACNTVVERFGSENTEKTIIEILDMPVCFEDKLWALYSKAYCGEAFFEDLVSKIANFCNFEATPFKDLKRKAFDEQDIEKKKNFYFMIACLSNKYSSKNGLIEMIKAEIMKSLSEGTLYI